jgi:hypothetical protein
MTSLDYDWIRLGIIVLCLASSASAHVGYNVAGENGAFSRGSIKDSRLPASTYLLDRNDFKSSSSITRDQLFRHQRHTYLFSPFYNSIGGFGVPHNFKLFNPYTKAKTPDVVTNAFQTTYQPSPTAQLISNDNPGPTELNKIQKVATLAASQLEVAKFSQPSIRKPQNELKKVPKVPKLPTSQWTPTESHQPSFSNKHQLQRVLSKIQKVSKSQELQAKPKKIKKKTQNETPKQLSEDLSKVVEPFSPKVADSRVEKTKPSKPSAKPSKPLAKPSKTVEPFFPSVVDSTSKETKPSIASNVKLEAVQDTFDQIGAEIDLSNSVSPKFKVFPAVPDEDF